MDEREDLGRCAEEGCGEQAASDDRGARFCRRHRLWSLLLMALGVVGILLLLVFVYLLVSPGPFPP